MDKKESLRQQPFVKTDTRQIHRDIQHHNAYESAARESRTRVQSLVNDVDGEAENRNVVADETTTTNVLKEKYTESFEHGTNVKLTISIEIENYSSEDLQELLSHIATCSRNFYVVTGKAMD